MIKSHRRCSSAMAVSNSTQQLKQTQPGNQTIRPGQRNLRRNSQDIFKAEPNEDIPLYSAGNSKTLKTDQLRKRLISKALEHSTRGQIKVPLRGTTPNLSRISAWGISRTESPMPDMSGMSGSEFMIPAPRELNSSVIKFYEDTIEKHVDEANHYKHLYKAEQEKQVQNEYSLGGKDNFDNISVQKLTQRLKETEKRLLDTETELRQYKSNYEEIKDKLLLLEEHISNVQAPQEDLTLVIDQMKADFARKERVYQQKIADLTKNSQQQSGVQWEKRIVLSEIQAIRNKINSIVI